jgi:hypothetical protein
MEFKFYWLDEDAARAHDFSVAVSHIPRSSRPRLRSFFCDLSELRTSAQYSVIIGHGGNERSSRPESGDC